MKKFTKLEIFLFVTLVGCLGVGTFLSSETNRAAFGSRGGIFKGEKFGLHIGSETTKAINILSSKGYSKNLQTQFSALITTEMREKFAGEIQISKSCMGYSVATNETFEIFYDNSWRQGSVCIVSKDGIVERILWHFDWMQP